MNSSCVWTACGIGGMPFCVKDEKMPGTARKEHGKICMNITEPCNELQKQ